MLSLLSVRLSDFHACITVLVDISNVSPFDGMPNDILPSELSEQGKTLLDQIKKLAKESKLSYVEINKALYLADKELYIEKINN